MNCRKFLAALALLFLFQNTFSGNDNPCSIAPFAISAVPAIPPAPPAVPVIGNGSLSYSVSIIKNLLNGTPLTQEEKRFPKIALGLTALNVLFSCACLKMIDQPISMSNVALINVVNLPITWFFSEFLNGEWDD